MSTRTRRRGLRYFIAHERTASNSARLSDSRPSARRSAGNYRAGCPQPHRAARRTGASKNAPCSTQTIPACRVDSSARTNGRPVIASRSSGRPRSRRARSALGLLPLPAPPLLPTAAPQSVIVPIRHSSLHRVLSALSEQSQPCGRFTDGKSAGLRPYTHLFPQFKVGSAVFFGSPKVHVGPELAEEAPGGPVTCAFPGFSLGVLVMGQGPVEALENAQCFPRRGGRVCASAAPAASTGRVRL